MGSYRIIETIEGPSNKFSCMVSFNNGNPELYEVEVPNDLGETVLLDDDGNAVTDEKGNLVYAKIPLPPLNSALIDAALQKAADDLEAAQNVNSFEPLIADGKIVVE